ncbi:MAG: diguanylate cyclase domain-containing protein [Chthoniobacterales bacterium]
MPAPRDKPPALWSPVTILKPWGWFLGLLAFIAAIAGFAEKNLSFVQRVLAPQGNYINAVTFTVALLVSNFLTFYLLYRRLFKERMQRRDDADENANLRVLLDDIERERLLDLHTGIPNEKKFKNDFAALKQSDLSVLPAQVVLIDIDAFGSVNNTYGYQKGNEIIRLIAQRMFSAMRRNEEIYTPRESELYRRFTGGDEFVFLLRGPQFEAVGFLARLHDTLRNKLSPETASILQEQFKINFHGAISPIYERDDYEDAVLRLEQCYVKTKKPDSTSRVFWWKKEENNFPEGDFRRAIYENAIKQFTIAPAS